MMEEEGIDITEADELEDSASEIEESIEEMASEEELDEGTVDLGEEF